MCDQRRRRRRTLLHRSERISARTATPRPGLPSRRTPSSGLAVIMDLRAIDAADAQRVRDYVVDAAFALRADASALGIGVYLVTMRDLPPEQERQLRHRCGS
ncbi:cell division protein SepF [Parafrankia discariae]|uniref:cell division protein SepF n=1 Tax=Parafrankia discariae TaxID=365528 RepID=UPI0012B6A5CA|nr:cell division protein SepF [Parafrankia discariae]